MLAEPGCFPCASGAEKKEAFLGLQWYVNNAFKHGESSSFWEMIPEKQGKINIKSAKRQEILTLHMK